MDHYGLESQEIWINSVTSEFSSTRTSTLFTQFTPRWPLFGGRGWDRLHSWGRLGARAAEAKEAEEARAGRVKP